MNSTVLALVKDYERYAALHDEEAEQHGYEEPAEIVQAFFQSGTGDVPAVEDGRFRRDYGLRLGEERGYELIAAEVGVYPCAYGLYAVRYLLGECYGFADNLFYL